MALLDTRLQKQTIYIFGCWVNSKNHLCTPKLVWGHFADQVDVKCNYCEEMDSHRHRVLHCKATQEARVQHSSICQQLEEAEDMQLAFPLAYKSPEDQFLQAAWLPSMRMSRGMRRNHGCDHEIAWHCDTPWSVSRAIHTC